MSAMNKDQKTLPRFVKDLMIQTQPGIILRVMGTSFLVLISIIWLDTGLQGCLEQKLLSGTNAGNYFPSYPWEIVFVLRIAVRFLT